MIKLKNILKRFFNWLKDKIFKPPYRPPNRGRVCIISLEAYVELKKLVYLEREKEAGKFNVKKSNYAGYKNDVNFYIDLTTDDKYKAYIMEDPKWFTPYIPLESIKWFTPYIPLESINVQTGKRITYKDTWNTNKEKIDIDYVEFKSKRED
jgi:hypothetical protein